MRYIDRKPGQTLIIDGAVRISVVRIEGQTVRLAVDAPLATVVLRGEIHSLVSGPTGGTDDVPSR